MSHAIAGQSSRQIPGERDPEVALKWAKAIDLRRTGLTYDQIAERLGYASRSGAYDAVMGGLRATLKEPADELRALESERLDALLAGIWEQATHGDLDCLDRALKIMARRAALLGLDAPARADIRTSDQPLLPPVQIVHVIKPDGVD